MKTLSRTFTANSFRDMPKLGEAASRLEFHGRCRAGAKVRVAAPSPCWPENVLDTGSAAGRLVITIMGAVSQWEREAIGERTRDALRHKRSNGERVGNIEFGYRLSSDLRHLESDPTEQVALEEIRNPRREGQKLRGIAATMNSRGHRTRRGTQWRLESVARVIKQQSPAPA